MSGHLVVEGLALTRGDLVVLDDVSFEVAAGGCLGLIGPTGCGKSSVLRILAGLLHPDAGCANVDGASLIGRPGQVGYMPQADTLLPWRRALDNAVLGARIDGRDLDRAVEHARGLFQRFGLSGFERAWPHQLSGGMRQRVALLRTVLVDRPVVLLDEPLGALDAITRIHLQGWLHTLLASTDRTAVLVTHDVDEALRLCDAIVVMSGRPGRVLSVLTPPGAHPRGPQTSTNPDFAIMKREILHLLSDSLE